MHCSGGSGESPSGRPHFAGMQLEVVSSFCYVSITFAAGQPLAAAAAPACMQAARAAKAACNQRCRVLGVVATGMRLRFSAPLGALSALSWRRGVGSAAWRPRYSRQHPRRHLWQWQHSRVPAHGLPLASLGVRQATPNAAVRPETGERSGLGVHAACGTVAQRRRRAACCTRRSLSAASCSSSTHQPAVGAAANG
jgi:hypothetical protein